MGITVHSIKSLSQIAIPATKWKKNLFQVGSCPSIPSDTDGSRRHCEDSCNHNLRSLGLRMLFGLRNAAQSFHRFIDQVFRGSEFVYVYIDDVFIARSNPEDDKLHLRQVFQRLN